MKQGINSCVHHVVVTIHVFSKAVHIIVHVVIQLIAHVGEHELHELLYLTSLCW